jgi:hypothetical protein
MIQAPESSSHVRKNPRFQFTCVLLLAGVSTTRRGIPKCGIRGCSDMVPTQQSNGDARLQLAVAPGARLTKPHQRVWHGAVP